MKKLLFIFFTTLNLIQCPIHSQVNIIDSLLTLLNTSKVDSTTVNTLNALFLEYEFSDGQKAMECLNKALELSKRIDYKSGLANTYTFLGYFAEDKGNYPEALNNYFASLKVNEEIGDKSGIANGFNNLGNVYNAQSKYHEAIKNHFESLKIKQILGDKSGIANSYNNIGNVCDALGNYPEALKNYFASLKIKEEIGDKKGIARSYNNIGNIYNGQRNYPEALKNHFLSLKLRKEIGDKNGMASSYNNIGNIYESRGNFTEALKNHLTSLEIEVEIDDKRGIAISYNNIGNVYCKMGDYSEALKKYFNALQIRKVLADKKGIAISYGNIGVAFTEQKKYNEAKEYLMNARDLSNEIGLKECLINAFNYLTFLDSAQGNYKGAYENHKLYILYRDSLDNEETRKKTIQSQMTYDFEKKEAVVSAEHKKELENQGALAEEKSRKQKAIIGFVGFGLLLVFVFSGFIFRSLRLTRKQKIVIEEQKEIVEHQKEIIEEKNRETTDSITYAKRIQFTLLANKQLLDANLPEHFVLFKPKDIVSGDFYWATEKSNSKFQISKSEANELKSETSDRFYIAACDSTGHGVPGAFMSLLNISFLNEAVNERNIVEPHEILNHVRKRLIENMDGGQDGMDCILVCIEKSNFENESNSPLKRGAGGIKITYAAANNSPTIIKNGKLISLEADKMPVGKGEKGESFTLRTIDVEKEDTLYLYTDGYADQFGGAKGKKFKYKQLGDLLVSVSNLPPVDQSKILNQRFEDWKGNLEQVDDMLLIGIRI